MGQFFTRIRRGNTTPEINNRREGDADGGDSCVVQRFSRHNGRE